MIRLMLGLGALTLLVGPIACLSDDGPEPFTTEGFCIAGDVEGCPCPSGFVGARVCGKNLKYEDACRCDPGCTVFPDCDRCGSTCFDACVCAHKGQTDECRAQCPDAS